MRYRIEISEKAREQLRALPKEVRRNIGQRMPAKHTKNSKGGEESFSCKIFRLFRVFSGQKRNSPARRETSGTLVLLLVVGLGDGWLEKGRAGIGRDLSCSLRSGGSRD